MSLDLEEGDETLADASPAERRRAARKAARSEQPAVKKSTSRSARPAVRERVESELLSRLDRTFDRLAQMLDSRGDEELAHVIREDKDAMGQGLASLTRNVKFLRGPLLMALNLIEPALAFGRVARILYGRFAERQQRIADERAQAVTESTNSSPAPVTQ